MSARSIAAVLALSAISTLSSSASAYTVETLRSSGPSSRRIDVLIMGDGYRATDQAKLTADAQNVVNGLIGLSPYKEYANLFNIKLVHVISNQDGADNGQTYGNGVLRDTALGAYFWCLGIERLICVDGEATFSIAAAHAPEYDQVVVLVNDPLYGGAGGSPLSTVSTNSAAIEILRHELGHSIGGLADEYDDPFPGYPECDSVLDCPEANATLRNTASTLKWRSWLAAGTPVPTPENQSSWANVIGAFQGARYDPNAVYRPKDFS